MKIIVDHIYRQDIKKLYDAGWRVYDDPMYDPKISEDIEDRCRMRRLSGCEMVKDFASLGEAVRDFEVITGYDAISTEDQCGCPVFSFKCVEGQFCEAGWRLGAYLYKNWYKTPRECLEALNPKYENLGEMK